MRWFHELLSASLRLAMLLGCGIALVGCGRAEKPVARDMRDPTIYAGHIKSNVVSYLQYVKQRPAVGHRQIGFLIEKLEKYPLAPVGGNEQTYQQLLAACQELQRNYASPEGKPPAAKIDAVIAMANQLPGDLKTFGFE